ncbi:hypothetical protein HPB47_028193 [Ixodes persulcatus]|uniref:Uncharacterized protein n=1 Tax=Ixodes persulcatus TaxID=34615 RepID=A0AC60PUA1_IXOPE|nr:hypothetical protein HPB47_028193 [Ixodes persulcatus]
MEHNHASDVDGVKVTKVRMNLKRKERETSEPPSKLLAQALCSSSAAVRANLGSLETVRRDLRQQRSRLRPAEPESTAKLEVDGIWATTGGEVPQPFLIYDNGSERRDRMLVFASSEQLRALSTSPTWYMDGTFSVCPRLFKQLYVLRCAVGESSVACVYALLAGKSLAIYEELFSACACFSVSFSPVSFSPVSFSPVSFSPVSFSPPPRKACGEEVLKRYGYLQCGSRRRRNRHRGGGRDHGESWAGPRSCSAHELRKAVRLYQRNYSMPETGLLDPATLRVMSESRCGNPDIEAGALPQRSARRRKRRGATTAVARSSRATLTRRRRWLRDYVRRIETGQADRRACLVHSLVQSRRRNKRSVAPGFRIHIFAKDLSGDRPAGRDERKRKASSPERIVAKRSGLARETDPLSRLVNSEAPATIPQGMDRDALGSLNVLTPYWAVHKFSNFDDVAYLKTAFEPKSNKISIKRAVFFCLDNLPDVEGNVVLSFGDGPQFRLLAVLFLWTKTVRITQEVVTWRLIGSAFSNQLTAATQRAAIALAFRMWGEVIPVVFEEDLRSPVDDVDILVAFGRASDSGYCATEAHSWARGGASASAAAMTSLLWNAQTAEARAAAAERAAVAAPALQLRSRLGGSEARALAYGSHVAGSNPGPGARNLTEAYCGGGAV